MNGRRADGGNGFLTKRRPDSVGETGAVRPRHLRTRRRAPLWLKIASGVVSVALVAGIGLAGVLFLRFQGNIKGEQLNAGLDGTSAPLADDNRDAIQVLIMGTDTRSGKDANYGSEADSSGYGNSDVMMLMNLSADRKRVSMVSFPRDLMVPFPGCKDSRTGQVYPAQKSIQLNSALSMAGPGCTVETINKFTGLTVDHFMMADFTAVKDLTTALGGVDVCVNLPVVDPASGLNLPAGTSSISGEQALAFLRTRHAFGDGSDLDRIQSQQAFLASMSRKIKSEGTLGDVPKLLRIADIVTQNLTVDQGLSNAPALISMANRLKDVDLAKVAFVTVPNEPYTLDANRVQLKPEANRLFAALQADADLTRPTQPGDTAPASPSSTPAQPSFDRSLQPVIVSNASGLATRGSELQQNLFSVGYTNSVISDSVATQPSTQLLYGKNFADVAQDIAAKYGIPKASLVSAPALYGVQLVIGQDFVSGTAYGKATVPSDLKVDTAQEPTQCRQVTNSGN